MFAYVYGIWYMVFRGQKETVWLGFLFSRVRVYAIFRLAFFCEGYNDPNCAQFWA